jgi:hypothetical protein
MPTMGDLATGGVVAIHIPLVSRWQLPREKCILLLGIY